MTRTSGLNSVRNKQKKPGNLGNNSGYFPMQKRLKTRSSRSSV
jgi:hypothetical protein